MADKPKVINDSKKFVDELTKGKNVTPAKELTTRPKTKAPSPQGKAIGEDVDAAPYKKGGSVKYRGGRTEADIGKMISDADTQARKGSNSEPLFKKGGKVKKYANGGSVGRGDGCASKGKTRCRVI